MKESYRRLWMPALNPLMYVTGYDLEKLAKAAKLDETTVEAIRAGLPIRRSDIEAIARVLRVPEADMITE